MNFRYLYYIALALLVTSCVDSGRASDLHECREKINGITQSIVTEVDRNIRGESAQYLALYLHDHPECGYSTVVIDDLIHLLNDHDDSVRWGAAQSLANIGPPARRAVPALKKALEQSDAEIDAWLKATSSTVLPTRYSGQAIREALKNITGKPVLGYGK
jgi:hypothetical protein